MGRFRVLQAPLPGLRIVERSRIEDARGFLSRIFCSEDLRSFGWTEPISQLNHTFTRNKGAVRGLHLQRPPHAEMKLVSCLRGEVWDVAVDLRRSSQTFLQWHAEVLSPGNSRALLIPEGFAHGFQALSDDVELLYCHSKAYCAEAEFGLNPLDERLGIAWPLALSDISVRDSSHPRISQDFQGIDP